MAHVDPTPTLVMLACAFAAPPVTGAAVIEVAPGASVQAAIDAAADGDEITLAPGTYFESIDLRGRAVTVRSQDPRDPSVVAATVLDGGGTSTVVTCRSGEGSQTVLAGLTITGGFGMSGGGLAVDGSSPTIRNCRVLDNAAMFEGGGLFVIGGSPLVVSCTFIGNDAFYGGGMSVIDGAPLVTNSVFSGNTARATGGGLDNFFDAEATLANCTLAGNVADLGGALANTGGAPTVANCVLFRNAAFSNGDEIHDAGTAPTLVRASNVDGSGGSAAWDPTLGTDAGGNLDVDPAFVDADGADGTPGTADDDLRVAAGSPCVDAGQNASVPADMADLDGDGDAHEALVFDLAGEPRFADVPDAPNVGAADGRVTDAIVDMGAYELQAPESADCVGDLDGNGRVGFRDLVSMLSVYGTRCTACPEDLDGSGAVGLEDLMLLLEGWGLCDGTKDKWRGGRGKFGKRGPCGPARRVGRKAWRRR